MNITIHSTMLPHEDPEASPVSDRTAELVMARVRERLARG